MKYRVTIDQAACSAHGDCAAIAPDAFTVGETASVTGDASDQLMLEAAEACPVLAITVTDAETGEVIFP